MGKSGVVEPVGRPSVASVDENWGCATHPGYKEAGDDSADGKRTTLPVKPLDPRVGSSLPEPQGCCARGIVERMLGRFTANFPLLPRHLLPGATPRVPRRLAIRIWRTCDSSCSVLGRRNGGHCGCSYCDCSHQAFLRLRRASPNLRRPFRVPPPGCRSRSVFDSCQLWKRGRVDIYDRNFVWERCPGHVGHVCSVGSRIITVSLRLA